MSRWPQKSVGDVAVIERDSIQPSEIKTGTSYLGLEHIESGGKILSVPEVSKGDLASSKFHFTSKHILYGKLRPYLAKIACPDFDGVCSTDILPILPNDNMDKRYICYFLRQPDIVALANSRSSGANLPRLSPTALSEILLPVPPLSEQKRIAEILDRAEALRAKRRAALALLHELTQSIFLDMFGDPVTNSLGLTSVPLGELLKFKSGDFLPANKMATDGTFPVLGGNGVNGWHDEYLFEDRKIVVGRVGAYCGCVHIAPRQSWITDNALYVAEHDSRLTFDYLVHALTHAKLNQYASQSGQPLISGSRIYPVHILLPPLQEQIDFAKRIAAVEQLRKALTSSHKELDQLFASLQHRAFRGEL